MKKSVLFIVSIVVVAGLLGTGIYFVAKRNSVSVTVENSSTPSGGSQSQASQNPPINIPGVNHDGVPLVVPDNFTVSVFAKGLPNARVLAFDSQGNLWVSQTKSGIISKLVVQNSQVTSQQTVYSGLHNPHGLAFDPQSPNTLYFAEETKISKVKIDTGDAPQKIIDLPDSGGDHYTRTLGFGPDSRLYVSIGSSCNVCYESDPRRAAIYSLNRDGSDSQEVASGLRNAVFFTWSPTNQVMWATENGRDYLGDNLPPDELNVIEQAGDYGWPVCYGQNIHDSVFDKNQYIQNPCNGRISAKVDLQAHSAPLGIAFMNGAAWPSGFQNDLIVAFHGSWNRSIPTGYKLVRVPLDENGNQTGPVQDFVSGWLTSNFTVAGRPVDVLIQPYGAMFVSDDKLGLIYKITYQNS